MKRVIQALFVLSMLTVSPLFAAEGESETPLTGPAAPAAAARLDDWIIIGPGGGGGQFIPTISPHDTDTACVRCDMTGTFITHDGGASWRMFNFRSTANLFVFDPINPDVIYVKSVGFYRSEDAGKTWNLVHPSPEDVDGVVINGDHGETSLHIKASAASRPHRKGWTPQDELGVLAVDPADSKVLYGAIGNDNGTDLCISKDYGKSWETIGALPAGAGLILIDPRSPRDERDVYVLGYRSVSLLSKNSLTHYDPPQNVDTFADASGGFDPVTGKAVFYGITGGRRMRNASGGLFVSTDGGKTWVPRNDALMKNAVEGARMAGLRSIGASLGDGRVAYVSYRGLSTADGDNCFGVAKTSDAGKSWSLVWKETRDKIGENMTPGWMALRFGSAWGENPISIGVAPTDSDIVYTTDFGRTLKSSDGGKTWHGVYSKRMGEDRWTTRGLDVTTCYGVHADPFDESRLLISYTDVGLFASDDYGVTWQSATTNGVPQRWVNTTYWMEFDPEVKGKAWAVMSSTHDLPRPKMWRWNGRVRQSGGVCVSEDGGRSWEPCTGLPQTPCTHVLIDPASPSGSRTLYVTGFGTGVWKSTDGGKTWAKKNNGIAGDTPFAWRLARDKNGVLYAIVARKSDDGSYGNDEDGALYRSTNGAESWQRITLPEGLNGPSGLYIDPDDPDRLHLAAWGREGAERASMGGIWLSENAGKTWKNVLSKDQYVYDVTAEPGNPDNLYACGFSSYAWRSTDRGETWSRIKGFNFKWGHRVCPDPHNPDKIFITTFGGSVWYGPAAGDPDAPEDIMTPQISYSIVDRKGE
jgi:photosystem II stability/assembly factor-like uncharacterized protein